MEQLQSESQPSPESEPEPEPEGSIPFGRRFKHLVFGSPRSLQDPKVFHRISLIAILAWVGLGADGLSSSAYGPEEAFKALGEHTYLAIGMALATALTVAIIAYSYSKVIEHFPFGGGGYVVASNLLGPKWGVISGSALLVDYVLTISVSIASGADQVFSVLPPEYHSYKLVIVAIVIGLMMLLNLRGVKESVSILAPVFFLFLITHAVLIIGGIISHVGGSGAVASEIKSNYSHGMSTLGMLGMLAIFFRAYSMGAGTYTGIEAVSNGLAIMREPKVETGKRTMILMAVSLALTAGGILICYLLFHTKPVAGQTMNAVLLNAFAGNWHLGSWAVGHWFVLISLASEAALLFVAAQAGFIDGPRVMANMANDSWLPHRFTSLSDRLTTQNGIIIMSLAALATLFYTGGETDTLVLMYSINVFLTFSLTQTAMIRYWFRDRAKHPNWYRAILVHVAGFVVCFGILVLNIVEKFAAGGWITMAVTLALITFCLLIKRHYQKVVTHMRRLDDILTDLPITGSDNGAKINPKDSTAIILVGGYGGLGIHTLLNIVKLFHHQFKNYIFVSVGVIDSVTLSGIEEVDRIRDKTEKALEEYADLTRRLGYAADWRMSIGTEVISEAEKLCRGMAKEFPNSVFFASKLVFEREKWYQRFLHNETAAQLQRSLQFDGLTVIILPVRVLEATTRPPTVKPKLVTT